MEISRFNIVPNKVASDYIRGRAAIGSSLFGNLPDAIKARAFTVARIEDVGVLEEIQDAISRLPEGGDWKKTRDKIAQYIAGDTETDKGHKARAAFVMRVNGMAAHAKLNGLILRHDHPFWKNHYPPWEWGCRCYVTKITEAMAADYGVADARTLGEMLGDDAEEDKGGFSFNPASLAIDLAAVIDAQPEVMRGVARELFRDTLVELEAGKVSLYDVNAPEYAPPKTRAEALAFAQKYIAHNIDVPDTIDDDLLIRVVDVVRKNMRRQGVSKFETFRFVKGMGDGIAWVNSPARGRFKSPDVMELGVSEAKLANLFKNYRTNAKIDAEMGKVRELAFSPDVSDRVMLQHVFDHEFGHVLYNKSRIAGKKFDAGSIHTAMKVSGEISGISAYAAENEREMFAEAFAMYERGDIIPPKLLKLIKEVTK